MQKLKNRKEFPQVPEILLWEVQFEFLTSLSLDESASRLHEMNATKSLFSPSPKAALDSVDQEKILFQLTQWGGALGDGWIVGDLETVGNRTHVRGKLGTSPIVIYPILLIAIGLIAGLVVTLMMWQSLPAFLLVLGLIGFMVFAGYVGIRNTRTRLMSTFKQILAIENE